MNKLTEISKITGLFLVWRTGLLIISWLANQLLSYQPSFPYSQDVLANSQLPQWLYSWANFDGVHYLTIAQKGYHGTGLIQAFFPVYPLLIKTVAQLTNLTHFSALIISGLAISNLSLWLLLILLYYLVKKHFTVKIAWLTLVMLLIFPSSFFLGAVYNEALFLTLLIGSFLAAEKKHWWLASILAGLASATRVVGVFLIPALLITLWQQQSTNTQVSPVVFVQKNWNKILIIMTGSLGLLGYMFYLQLRFQDPLYFLHVQSEFGAGRQENLILYPQVVWRSIKILLTTRPFNWKYYSYLQDFIIGIGGLGLIIWSWLKENLPLSYIVFALLAFLTPTLTGTFSSMPRYALVCLPIFLYLAKKLSKNKFQLIVYLLISLIFLLINTILFIQGYWVA
ncbi:MAG: hypothetical protein GF390_03175 [Candidatus Pacebacteria bacterium]|nr:hypothetical protein [Candidatus Paceibacterota bacterium]